MYVNPAGQIMANGQDNVPTVANGTLWLKRQMLPCPTTKKQAQNLPPKAPIMQATARR